jgi:hypothetical protein
VQVFIHMTADGTARRQTATQPPTAWCEVGGMQYLVVYPPRFADGDREPEGGGSDLEGAISEALVERVGSQNRCG